MSDNVTEIKPTKLSEPVIAADGSVVRVDEEGWEYDASNEARQPEGAKDSGAKLRVGIVGDNLLARANIAAFNTKSAETNLVESFDQVDDLIAWRPAIAFICQEIPLMKNDTFDDADFLNAVNKLVKQTECGICIRSTLNIETIQRLMQALGPDVFGAKVVYMPEMSDASDLGVILAGEQHVLGGEEKAVGALLNLLKHTSHFSAQTLSTGTVWEVAYAKLGVAGFKAVKQTFFNQFYDTILDVKNANPVIVRRLMEQSPEINDRSVMIPTFVRAKIDDTVSYKQARAYGGEYLNHDVRALVGMSDKLPLLDECVNFKNLKD